MESDLAKLCREHFWARMYKGSLFLAGVSSLTIPVAGVGIYAAVKEPTPMNIVAASVFGLTGAVCGYLSASQTYDFFKYSRKEKQLQEKIDEKSIDCLIG